MSTDRGEGPHSDRDDGSVQGHWLLARLGKRVVRPGGAELTETLLDRADLAAEYLGAAWRFAANPLRQCDTRRVLTMRQTFRTYRSSLTAVAAHKPERG